MLSKRTFRLLVLADLLLVAAAVIFGLCAEQSLPEPLREFERSRAEAEMTAHEWVLIGAGIPLLIAMVAAYTGLCLFWRAARPLYLAVIITDTLLTPIGGPYIASGWVQALDCASLIISGMVLALSYFSPASSWFVVTKDSSPPATHGE